jgi:hypothetical protein
MSTKPVSTRRRFFGQAGSAFAAPLAASAALASGAAHADDASARLEDANAIRALQREYARCVNTGAHAEAAQLFATPGAAAIDPSVRRLAGDRFTAEDAIHIDPGGAFATAQFECVVETERSIAGAFTLIDMLRAQGGADFRVAERRVLESSYVKERGRWRISRLKLRPV